jgi:hypothetical protein
MAKVSVMTLDKAPVAETPPAKGIETRVYFDRSGDPIHLHLHEMQPGATLTLEGKPTDRLAYVWEGEVEVGGETLDKRSSLIVEHGSSTRITASAKGAKLLEFNMRERPANPRAGGHVHLLPNRIVPRAEKLSEAGTAGGALHADAHCPTCEIWLHENDFYTGDHETALHSHSEDEVIFVRDGAIKLGNRLYGPGTALAIGANVKYEFWTGPEGMSFVNFRGASPTYTTADGSHVLDEAKFWQGAVGAPQYLEPQAA